MLVSLCLVHVRCLLVLVIYTAETTTRSFSDISLENQQVCISMTITHTSSFYTPSEKYSGSH